MKPLFALLFTAFAAQAQVVLPPGSGPQFFQVKEFLQLTDAQFITIFNNNTDISRRLSEVFQRMGQLQQEITIELNQENPDPAAIGTRQVESEKICRVAREEANGILAKNQSVLTDAQRTKLKTLEEIGRQAVVINEAQSFRILGDITVPGPNGTTQALRIAVTPVIAPPPSVPIPCIATLGSLPIIRGGVFVPGSEPASNNK